MIRIVLHMLSYDIDGNIPVHMDAPGATDGTALVLPQIRMLQFSHFCPRDSLIRFH